LRIEIKPAKLTPQKKEIFSFLDACLPELNQLNDQVWSFAEVVLEEYKSSELLASFLEKGGVEVERGVAGMPAAFVATYGSGEPVIGILAECDALPGLSQEIVSSQKPLEAGKPGHGCGHNVFSAASVAAASALKRTMLKNSLAGTLKLFGCQAEETVLGKAFMGREGLFDGLVAAKVMAISANDFFTKPELIQKMRAEWAEKKKGQKYKSPLPPDLKPPLKSTKK